MNNQAIIDNLLPPNEYNKSLFRKELGRCLELKEWMVYFANDEEDGGGVGSLCTGDSVRELCERHQALKDAAKAAKDSLDGWGLACGLSPEKSGMEWKNFLVNFDRLVKLAGETNGTDTTT